MVETKRLTLRPWEETDAVVLKETGEPVGSIGLLIVAEWMDIS